MFPLCYRDDPGLSFLQFCSHADLQDLADILMRDKGKLRQTEQLSAEPRFRNNREDLTKVWDIIAAELQRFGADTVASIFRGGKGILYREILGDICGQMKVQYRAGEELTAIESRLLLKVLEKSLEAMSEEERAEFARNAAEMFGNGQFDPSKAIPSAILAALQSAVAAGGFAAYQVSVIAANAVSRFVLGRGLTLAANAGLTRLVATFAGPIGWAISAILAVPLVSGPANRVTVPAVIFVAYLRQKHLNQDQL